MNKPGKAIRRMWKNHQVFKISLSTSPWIGRMWILASNYYGKIVDFYLTDHTGDLQKTIEELKEKVKPCLTQ